MGTSKTSFVFHDTDHANKWLKVTIPEVASASYGLFIWPCAPVLAQYVWQRRSHLSNKHVLELGAGTALPGIVAAKCGALVTLSDCARYKQCLEQCGQSAEENGVTHVRVVGITWGQISPPILELEPVDVVLASDCFYDTKDFEDVLFTMAFILESNPDAEIWCSYQERSSERSIVHLLNKWDLYAEPLEYPDMEQLESRYDKHKACVIQLFVIRKRQRLAEKSIVDTANA